MPRGHRSRPLPLQQRLRVSSTSHMTLLHSTHPCQMKVSWINSLWLVVTPAILTTELQNIHTDVRIQKAKKESEQKPNTMWPEPFETSYNSQSCLPHIVLCTNHFFINYVNAIWVCKYYFDFSEQQVVSTDAIIIIYISEILYFIYEVIILALSTLEKVSFGSLHVNQTEIKCQSNVILILKLN